MSKIYENKIIRLKKQEILSLKDYIINFVLKDYIILWKVPELYEDKKDSKENEAFETQEKVNVNQNAERKNNNTDSQDDVMFILLILLCLIIPPLAVFLITEDLKTTLISLLLTILFWLPGVIFAFYILFTRY